MTYFKHTKRMYVTEKEIMNHKFAGFLSTILTKLTQFLVSSFKVATIGTTTLH